MTSNKGRARGFWGRFSRLWTGQLLSAVGEQFFQVAVVWVSVNAAAQRAGWVVAAAPTARLLFGLVGGVYADRLDRQRLLIACDVLCALAVASLVFVGRVEPSTLWWFAAVSFSVGALGSFFEPGLQASLPAFAPDPARLHTANAWLDVNRRLALMIGPAIAGSLLTAAHLPAFFAFDAATFAISALAIASLGRRYAWRPESRRRGGMLPEIASAAREAYAHRDLRFGLAQNALWNLVLTPALSLGVALLVREELGSRPEWLGYLLTAYGVGNVAANLVLARLRPGQTAILLHAGALVASLGWLVFSYVREPAWLLVVTALTALGGPMTDLMLLRIIQGDFPSDRVGRVYSLRVTLSRTAGALGLACAVPIYTVLGTRAAIATGACALGAFAAARLLATLRWSGTRYPAPLHATHPRPAGLDQGAPGDGTAAEAPRRSSSR